MGFCIEFEPFALRYSRPRDFNQVMVPFSASPLSVQLSGFVSRLFPVAKCFFLRVLLCPVVERNLATYDDEDDDENNGKQRDGFHTPCRNSETTTPHPKNAQVS